MIVCKHRLFVPFQTVESFRPLLERTQRRVRLSQSEYCEQYAFRGVPARRVDVGLTDTPLKSKRTVLEICRTSSRYDDSERWSLFLRNWDRGQTTFADSENKHQLIPSGTCAVHQVLRNLVVLATWDGGSWKQSFPCLHLDLRDYDLASIILWHSRRFYPFLPLDEVRALAASFEAMHPELRSLTLAEANRLATTDLFRLASSLGWRKLKLVHQQKFGIHKEWVRQEEIAERCRLMGLPTTG